jgi:putative phage-type endonuclease
MLEINLSQEEQRAAWFESRRQGIGGSDAPAILGLSPWKSPLALWAEKTGLVEAENIFDREYIEWGSILEEPIAAKYARVTRRCLIDHGRHDIRFSPAYPFLHCTIDREIVDMDGRGSGSLSIKTATGFGRESWDEDVPLFAQIQLQHELIVRDWSWGSFAVLIAGRKFLWCDTGRNERFCQFLLEQEASFWNGVERGIPPEVDPSDSTREILGRLYPKDSGQSIELPIEAIAWDEQLTFAKAEIKAAEERKQDAENRLKAAIGAATIGLLPGGGGYTWKASERKGYVVEPTTVRTLRRIKSERNQK